MKLSQAIREGAKLRPQATRAYFKVNEEGVLCSCVLGAALEAAEVLPDDLGDFQKSHEIFLENTTISSDV